MNTNRMGSRFRAERIPKNGIPKLGTVSMDKIAEESEYGEEQAVHNNHWQ